jgi:hypothetical protein
MARSYIDNAPIRRVITEWLAANNDDHGTSVNGPILCAKDQFCRLVYPGSRIDVARRRLYELMNVSKEMHFDLADHILCSLDRVHLWREDPELAAIYNGYDFTALDIVKPTCAQVKLDNDAVITKKYMELGSKKGVARVLGVGPEQITAVLAAAAA